MPLVKKEGKFEPADWEQALDEITAAYHNINPKGNEFKAIAGELTDVESMVVMKDMANRLGSDNLTLDTPAGSRARPPRRRREVELPLQLQDLGC